MAIEQVKNEGCDFEEKSKLTDEEEFDRLMRYR